MISRQFIRDFITYSAGSVVTQLSNILLILFLMYRLPAHEVGFFSLSMSSILLISTLISCGLRQLFMLEFFNLNSQNKKEFVNDIIGIYLILSLFFWLLILAGYSYVNTFLFAKSANINDAAASGLVTLVHRFRSSLTCCCLLASSRVAARNEVAYRAATVRER